MTSRERLGIMGGSNGGLLMGAVLTQRPDIAAAVVCAVPVLDMLRNELTPNGAFVVTEFGTVRDPELFRALYAYSPYHNVVDGTAYPPVLFTAGEFDPRVDGPPRQEDGRPPAGGHLLRPADPAAHGVRRPRHRPVAGPGGRAGHRLLHVLLSTAWGCRTARPRSDHWKE